MSSIIMARVTVEDCLEHTDGVFNLVNLAAKRARRIANGSEILLEDDENDKPAVLALREIAEETVDPDSLRAVIIKGLQKLSNPEISDEDEEYALGETSDSKYTVEDELAEFKNNTEQNNELNSLQSGFQDVGEDVIKSEDL